jgi:hypothetical protein
MSALYTPYLQTSPRPKIGNTYTSGTATLEEQQQASVSVPQGYPAQAVGTTSNHIAEEFFAAHRRYAREHHMSMLELIAEHALDDLPISVGRMLKEYIEERKPKVKPGEVEYKGLFASGRPDLSERLEEIIYGPDSEDSL